MKYGMGLQTVFEFPILYKRTKNNSIQTWKIVVDENTYYTVEGLRNGKTTKSEPTVCKGKNIGKKNETSDKGQAYKEAEAKFDKKLTSGYFKSINDIDRQQYVEPMLAKKFEDRKDKINISNGVYSNPKLDGVRCVVTSKGMFSRNGKPFVSVPHIFDELKCTILKDNPDLILDGELYADKYNDDFNTIISAVKKTKPTDKDLMFSKNIDYHIYDVVDTTKTFSERFLPLSESYQNQNFNNIKFVEAIKVTSFDKLTELYESYIEQGYEGQMVRLDDNYECKRSNSLLKRKTFIDEEYEILGIFEGKGNRQNTAGYMTFKTKEGKSFRSNIKGNFSYLSDLLKNSEQYIGKTATIKYFNKTPDGIPRFPFVTNIAREDYE